MLGKGPIYWDSSRQIEIVVLRVKINQIMAHWTGMVC
jgi:hypothetical protein